MLRQHLEQDLARSLRKVLEEKKQAGQEMLFFPWPLAFLAKAKKEEVFFAKTPEVQLLPKKTLPAKVKVSPPVVKAPAEAAPEKVESFWDLQQFLEKKQASLKWQESNFSSGPRALKLANFSLIILRPEKLSTREEARFYLRVSFAIHERLCPAVLLKAKELMRFPDFRQVLASKKCFLARVKDIEESPELRKLYKKEEKGAVHALIGRLQSCPVIALHDATVYLEKQSAKSELWLALQKLVKEGL